MKESKGSWQLRPYLSMRLLVLRAHNAQNAKFARKLQADEWLIELTAKGVNRAELQLLQ